MSDVHGLRATAGKPLRKPAGSRTSPATSRATQALIEEAARLSGALRVRGSADFVQPMLTTASKVAPAGDDWLHEWKWDGYRLIAATGTQGARLWSRNGLSWEHRVPELAEVLSRLGVEAVLDGELVALDQQGYSDFNALQLALKSGKTSPLVYVVFDLMRLGDIDLTQVELRERKRILRRFLENRDPRVFYSDHLEGHGPDVFETARRQGMEGIISKRMASHYRSGRGPDWLKIKAVETREFVVVGYTEPKGSRKGIGALLLGRIEADRLVYAGRVGSGLSDAMLQDLPSKLHPLKSERPVVPLPAHTPLPAGRVFWVTPRLVVEVIFRGWGKEGLLRQASFLHLREDRSVSSELEQPEPLPALTSPDRVVYPDIGVTKQQVYDYYLEVGDRLLEEIGGRLLSVVRCPNGIEGARFFQKHAAAGFGPMVKKLSVREATGSTRDYFYVENLAGLMKLVQLNAIEFHPWGSHVSDLERPDRMVFDLDPGPGVDWPEVRRAARDLHDHLADIGVTSFPRLTGGKGVHVVVPLAPRADWNAVRRFAEAFATVMVQRQPECFVVTMSKAKRPDRIFIDWLRNSRGATSIAAWSLRARANAPAAVLLEWEDLARLRRPDRYTIRDAASRHIPASATALIASPARLPDLRRVH